MMDGSRSTGWRVARSVILPLVLTLVAGCAPVAEPPAPASAPAPALGAAPAAGSRENGIDPARTVARDSLASAPDPLRARLELAIEHVRARQLYTNNAFWTIFHGILGLGPGLAIADPKTGDKVNALDYIFGGNFAYGEVRGMRFIPTDAGLDVQTGPTFVGQGHQDQFVAEFAQWNVPIDKRVVVYGREYAVRDFVHEVLAHVRTEGQELSWAIVVIGQYLGTNLTWKNRAGETLVYDDIVRFEVKAPVNQAACGGTHRLFGLTWAYHLHLRNGGTDEGVWKEVSDHLDKHVRLAREYQNPDGSFSSNYFRGKGSTADPKDRLGSSGHILEWLAAVLPDEELKAQWMQDGANAVAMMILDIQSAEMESGALYHATHGLILYYSRVYGWDTFRGHQAPTLTGQGQAPTPASDELAVPIPPPSAELTP